jgi:hypothetical protein
MVRVMRRLAAEQQETIQIPAMREQEDSLEGLDRRHLSMGG